MVGKSICRLYVGRSRIKYFFCLDMCDFIKKNCGRRLLAVSRTKINKNLKMNGANSGEWIHVLERLWRFIGNIFIAHEESTLAYLCFYPKGLFRFLAVYTSKSGGQLRISKKGLGKATGQRFELE